MTEDRLPRKLAVIMHADVVGYSRLAGMDEDSTHRLLKHYLELMDHQVSAYHGHIVNTAGDAVLAVFDAVVNAVSCAIAIQHEVNQQNREIPEDRRIEFRIGVNLGDVIEDNGNVFGDGVNVAARLEGLAIPGGICVSEQVYLAVNGKLQLNFKDLGAQEVKNISEPVRAYQIQLTPQTVILQPSEKPGKSRRFTGTRLSIVMAIVITLSVFGFIASQHFWKAGKYVGSSENTTVHIVDKPSIAVMPFTNLTNDTSQEYFADGITEDLITSLSRFTELFVIAKRSSFVYKDKNAGTDQIARELGVQYLLEGSVRKTDSEITVTAQLVDTYTGSNVWTEKYQRSADLFHTIQDDLLDKIVSTVADRVENLELRISSQKQTENLTAYDHVLRGYALVFQWSKQSNEQAQAHFQEAIALDPQYARAYSGLAFSHNMDFARHWSEDLSLSLEFAREASLKAIALDDNDNRPHITLGWAYINSGDIDQGISEIKKGIELNPNDADVLARSGYALIYSGEFQQAIDQVQKAIRINPFHPDYYYDVLAWAQYFLKRYEDALHTLNKNSNTSPAQHRTLAATYARTGNLEKAKFHAEKLLEADPGFSLEEYRTSAPFKNQEHLEFHIESLKMAGLR